MTIHDMKDPEYTKNFKPMRVTVDGVELKRVIYADTEAGIARYRGDRFEVIEVRGKVEVSPL